MIDFSPEENRRRSRLAAEARTKAGRRRDLIRKGELDAYTAAESGDFSHDYISVFLNCIPGMNTRLVARVLDTYGVDAKRRLSTMSSRQRGMLIDRSFALMADKRGAAHGE